MKGHRLLLGFGVLSLGISLLLTILILTTGIALLGEHFTPGARSIWPILIFTCCASGLCCAVLSGLQFAQLATQERSLLSEQRLEAFWSDALLAWAFLETPLPRRLDQAGARTLLKLRDTMRGEVSDRMQLLYAQEGWLARDLNLLAQPRLPVVVRAETIERLALLREPRALDALSRELTHPHREVRALALLALARSVGRLGLHRTERTTRTLALHGAISRGQFSVGQVQEALTLLGDAGLLLARDLLTTGTTELKVATLDVLSRQRSAALHSDVTRLLRHDNAELRAGALKVLARSGRISLTAAPTVLALTEDATPFVRLQATKAITHLSPLPETRLWTLLGDPHWWVRRAAARGLIRAPGGTEILRRTVDSHPDRYARDVARAALSEHAEQLGQLPPQLAEPPVLAAESA